MDKLRLFEYFITKQYVKIKFLSNVWAQNLNSLSNKIVRLRFLLQIISFTDTFTGRKVH